MTNDDTKKPFGKTSSLTTTHKGKHNNANLSKPYSDTMSKKSKIEVIRELSKNLSYENQNIDNHSFKSKLDKIKQPNTIFKKTAQHLLQPQSLSENTANKNSQQYKPKEFIAKKPNILNLFLTLSFNLLLVCLIIITSSLLIPPTIDLTKNNKISATYYGKNSKIIGVRGKKIIKPLHFAEFSPLLISAIILIEDKSFYKHIGIDPFAILRAAIVNYQADDIKEGGSTITQQLVRNLYLSHDRTLTRKIKEIQLSIWYDGHHSKKTIIENYLNNIYFGRGAYGIQQASFAFFNKPQDQLSIKQIAFLVSLPKAPSVYSKNIKRALPRVNHIINTLYRYKYISKQQKQSALNERLHFISLKNKNTNLYYNHYGYFIDYAHKQFLIILKTIPKRYHSQNFHIQTTLDEDIQNNAYNKLVNIMNKVDRKKNITQAAFVALDHSGAIISMLGGISYFHSQFNRVTQAKRQPGSAFKTFVYAEAFEKGFTTRSSFTDRPFKIGNWVPRNYDGRYRGRLNLTKAFVDSINTIAVQLQEKTGRQDIINLANELGITTKLHPHPSLALGSEEVTLLDLSDAYLSVANSGKIIKPYAINQIVTDEGTLLYSKQIQQSKKVLSPKAAHEINYLLRQSVLRGTSHNAGLKNHHVAGKTGTTSDWRDAWFVGFTGYYVGGVWVGNDNNYRMNKVTGGSIPTQIWHDIMQDMHYGLRPRKLLGDINPKSIYLNNFVTKVKEKNENDIYQDILNDLYHINDY